MVEWWMGIVSIVSAFRINLFSMQYGVEETCERA